jgi:hypothetical protein
MEEYDEIDFDLIDMMDQNGISGINDFLDEVINNLTN